MPHWFEFFSDIGFFLFIGVIMILAILFEIFQVAEAWDWISDIVKKKKKGSTKKIKNKKKIEEDLDDV